MAANQTNLGAMTMGVARLALRAALQQAATTTRIVTHIAQRMCEADGGDFAKLSAGDQAVWRERARAAIAALVETVG
jgi:hypothetical protein